MAEDIPTRPPAKPPNEPWTPQEQAQHLTELLEGIDGWHDPSTQAEKKRQRHLRLITDQPDQTAA